MDKGVSEWDCSSREANVNRPVVLSGVIAIALLLAVALGGYLSGGWNIGPEQYTVASAEEPLIYSKHSERLLQLDREAVDNAYRHKIEQLFDVWMRDSTGQPERAVTGARIATKAYMDIMKELDRREEQLQKLKALSPQN